MQELLFSSAVCLAPFFIAFLLIVIIIVSTETLTGTVIGQWPEKLRAFFEKNHSPETNTSKEAG